MCPLQSVPDRCSTCSVIPPELNFQGPDERHLRCVLTGEHGVTYSPIREGIWLGLAAMIKHKRHLDRIVCSLEITLEEVHQP